MRVGLGSLILSALVDNAVGRVTLILTRLWLKSALRQIASTTKVESRRAPNVISGLAYPNMLIPLRIVSKTNMTLTVEQIIADVNFEGLYAGTVHWIDSNGKTIPKKGDGEIGIEFAPPLQVFLLNLSKCHLRNGIAKLRCSLGEVAVSFSTDSEPIDSFDQGRTKVKDLLKP